MTSLDLYALSSATDFYRLLQDVYRQYIQNPTERDFLFLAMGLTHLREWIADSCWDKIREKELAGVNLSDAEKFFVQVHSLDSFKVIRELCNRSKHHIVKNTKARTSKSFGFNVGTGTVADSLGQTYFLIDGNDSRTHFYEILAKYGEWFQANPQRFLLFTTAQESGAHANRSRNDG